MPLETQLIGLETKTSILPCGYKFNSRQELVNVSLEEKKDKDKQIVTDKGNERRG